MKSLAHILASALIATSCAPTTQTIDSPEIKQDFIDPSELLYQSIIKASTFYNQQNGNVIIVQRSKLNQEPLNFLENWEHILGYNLHFQGTINSSETVYLNKKITCNDYQGQFYKLGTAENVTPEIINQSRGGPLDCLIYINALKPKVN